jgi:hypothetical protein
MHFFQNKPFFSPSRKFMVATIRLGRKLRPLARWGFFDYPLCNYNVGHGSERRRKRGPEGGGEEAAEVDVEEEDADERDYRLAECRLKFRAYNELSVFFFN